MTDDERKQPVDEAIDNGSVMELGRETLTRRERYARLAAEHAARAAQLPNVFGPEGGR